MPTVVLIKKNTDVFTKKVKNLKLENIHKLCTYRLNKDFALRHTWKIKKNNYIHIFAKSTGRSTSINKFELPPPIDTNMYYGTMCLVKSSNKNIHLDNVLDFTAEQWSKDYAKLFGGFEDINDADSYESDELKNYPEEQISKDGYLKDGFVVSNDENEIVSPHDSDDEASFDLSNSDETDEDNNEKEDIYNEEEDIVYINNNTAIDDGYNGDDEETEGTEENVETDETDSDEEVCSELSEEEYSDHEY